MSPDDLCTPTQPLSFVSPGHEIPHSANFFQSGTWRLSPSTLEQPEEPFNIPSAANISHFWNIQLARDMTVGLLAAL